MKRPRSLAQLFLGFVAVAMVLCSTHAIADDYSDVSALIRAGKLPEALAKAEQYLAAQPRDPQMRFIKGVIQRDIGKTSEAITTFTKLTEDYPELPEPYNNLAVLYAGQSQFDKARAALEMAIRTNPSYATAHENLGDIYAKLASQAYNKALQLDSNNQAALAPKLALIREIFNSPAKAQRPAASSPGTPTAAAVAAVTAKPAPAAPVAPSAPAPVTPPATPVATNKPVASTTTASATTPAQTAQETGPANAVNEVEAAVANWAKVWSARDVKAYLASYGKEFDPPGSMGRKDWEEERQKRISSKSSISVKIDKLNVSVNGDHAVAKFLQDYKAGGLAVSSHKVLEFSKVGERWLIVKETVGK